MDAGGEELLACEVARLIAYILRYLRQPAKPPGERRLRWVLAVPGADIYDQLQRRQANSSD